jgi:hypothetical protein
MIPYSFYDIHKQTINLSILLLVTVILGGVFYFFQEKEAIVPQNNNMITSKPTMEGYGCDTIVEPKYRIQCMNNSTFRIADETFDISYCEKIEGAVSLKEECTTTILLKKALKMEDISICDQLTEVEIKKQCQASFYEMLSRYRDDISLCNRYPEKEANVCRDRFLVMKALGHGIDKDFSCTKIVDSDLRSDCEFLIQPRAAFSDMQSDGDCDQFKSDFLREGCSRTNIPDPSAVNTNGIYP